MSNVDFEDYSVKVKAAINDAAIAFLHAASHEIEAHAQRNCTMEDQIGTQLRGSYKSVVNEGKGEAMIGSPMEAAYWEEFGTGEYAATSKNGGKKGRKGWWVYVRNGERGSGGQSYNSQMEAEAVAASMRAAGLDAYATNGRKPAFTLEQAFLKNRAAIQKRAEELFGKLGK